MTIIGGAAVSRKLLALPKKIKDEVDKATAKSGEELIRIAKVLIPVGTGASLAAITGTANADGSFLCDFGNKAKVIEENHPFVNPALSVTRKKHKARAARAMNKAVKGVFGG